MITGDHAATAAAIAKQIGIIDETQPTDGLVLRGEEIDVYQLSFLWPGFLLGWVGFCCLLFVELVVVAIILITARYTDEDLSALNPFPTVFARVSPDNKLKIVRALRSRGEVVAMTGYYTVALYFIVCCL